jgi:hypothetical protein
MKPTAIETKVFLMLIRCKDKALYCSRQTALSEAGCSLRPHSEKRTSRDLAHLRWGAPCAMWEFPEELASEDNFRFADNSGLAKCGVAARNCR